MRYKLRTLLILLALAGMVLARIAYLKRCRDFHQQEVGRLIAAICEAEGADDKVADSVGDLAQAGTTVGTGSDATGTKVGLHNAQFVRWIKDSSTIELWKNAIHHQVLADRYGAAIYRPWTFVSE